MEFRGAEDALDVEVGVGLEQESALRLTSLCLRPCFAADETVLARSKRRINSCMGSLILAIFILPNSISRVREGLNTSKGSAFYTLLV